MLNNLLAAAVDKTRTVPILEVALYALLGFAIVFVGIAFLILVVWLVGKGMAMAKNRVDSAKKKAESAKIVEEDTRENVKESVAMSDSSEEISEETLAVITAAIMAYYQQTKPKCEFTVKRIKRI